MSESVSHSHKCPTPGCAGKVIHTSDICRNPTQAMLCNRCYFSQGKGGKIDSEWDPFDDQR